MWRKLFLLTSFVLAFAFSTIAMASDIAFYVGQFNTDGWYGEEQFTDVETIIAETGHLFNDIQQFNDDDLTFAAFNAWVDKRTNDGIMDIIWLNGCTPSCLYPNPNELPDGSRIEKWLDGGNMIINVGDWFAYCTYEGGPRGGEGRGGDNGGNGAANILDLSSGIIFGADGTQLTVTPAGKQYLPSLGDAAKTDRPVSMAAVEAPWEVAAIFASPGGTDDPAAEAHADPVVIHNTETGGYVAFINQASGGPDGWVADRGLTCAEFIGNWVTNVVGLVDMKIGYAVQPPVIDGEVDGLWAGASTQSFVPLEDPADGSGTWKVLYDAENLYVLVDMTDDSLQNDSSSSWQDDSVEIYFDGGNTKLDTPLSGDDHQYTFGWTTEDIQGTNVAGYTEGIEHAQATTDTGWCIEVKMPWQSIWGVEPQAGDLIGIDCYYNDDDDGGDSREGKMLSFSAVEGWNDASQWATAILATAPQAADPGTDGLLAYYALDGDPNDSSGNGIDGVIYNADTGGLGDGGSVWVDDPERGTVISFNGTADSAYVRAGEIPQMTLTNDFTWAFWAKQKAENTADNDIIFGNRMDENAVDFVPRQFIKFTPTKFEWHMNGNGDDNMEYEDIPADIWLHHAVVKTADQLTYYRNGIVASSGTITQPLDVPQPLFFGGDNEGSEGENWNGLMSDACIYDRALSAGEVMFLAGFQPGPVAHYKLDDGEGIIVVDSSGNGNDGTITTNPDFVDPTWITGILGGALEFYGDTSVYGSANHVECAHSDSLDVTGPISIALWIRPDTDDPEGQGLETAPMAKAHSAASPSWSWQVRYGWGSPQPYMAFTFNTSPRAWAYVGRNLERGVWAHIACSHDGETLKCYLNGEETDSTPMGAITSSPTPVLIGSDGWGCDWIGAIDDVRIYDRALSEAEIIGLAGN
jgi:hypothetical protein